VSAAASEFRGQEVTEIHELLAQLDHDARQWQTDFAALLDETADALRRAGSDYRQVGELADLSRAFDDDRRERRQQDGEIVRELRALRQLIEDQRRSA